METRLIKLVNDILKKDSTKYLWYKDKTLDGHFRIGSPEGSYIEYSREIVRKKPLGKLVVHQNENTELRWPVSHEIELFQLLRYLEQDAINLTQDPDYLKQMDNKSRVSLMGSSVDHLVFYFFNDIN